MQRKKRSRDAAENRGTLKTGWYGMGSPHSANNPKTVDIAPNRIAKSPPKEWLDLFGGDGGIDEMLARAPVTAIFATAVSMMKRRKEKGLSRRIRTPAARLRDSCAPLAS